MAINPFQRAICRLIAANRIAQGESYVGGGVALNLLTGGRRLSRDIDLFHDTEAALEATWAGQCVLHADDRLYAGELARLRRDLSRNLLAFHPGCIRGAYPQILP